MLRDVSRMRCGEIFRATRNRRSASEWVYGADPKNERRYSPAKIVSSHLEVIKGTPDPKHISTSYVERQNWIVRTNMRRYTRLSNGFSRKLENHEAAGALNY